MSPTSPANSRRALASLLVCAFAAAPAAAAPPPLPLPQDAAQRYTRCLALARRAPEEGLAFAEDWRNAAGGFPAEHCAGVALFEMKRYVEAARLFESLGGAMMEAAPALRANALQQAGQAWLLADRAPAAVAAFAAALSFAPDDPDLLIDRARAYAAERSFAAAVADLDAALGLAPKRADALVYRASAYRQLGRLGPARADIEAALKLDAGDPAAFLERGNIRLEEGDAGGAAVDWRKVAALAPDSDAARAARQNLADLARPQ